MKKRIISSVICVLLSFTVLSSAAWAEVLIAGTDVTTGYWKNNDTYSGVVAAEDENSANAYYKVDAENQGTLYLNNLNVNSADVNEYVAYAIAADSSLTVNLKGDNKISTADSQEAASAAMLVNGDLTVTGDGSLTATAGDAAVISTGIYAGSLSASDSVEISGTGGNSGEQSTGIEATGGISASSTAKISGTGGAAGQNSYGILSNDGISASDSAEISGSGTNGLFSVGVRATGEISASGNCEISGTGGDAMVSVGIAPGSDVTASDNAEIRGVGGRATGVPTNNVENPVSPAMSYGIYSGTSGELTASDSAEIRGTGGQSGTGVESSAVSYGIYYPDSITVSDNATVKGVGGRTNSESPSSGSIGILTGSMNKEFTGDALTVSGGTLTGIGGYSDVSSLGLMLGVGGIKFTDGVIIAKANEASGEAYGVSAHGLILPESYYWRTSESAALTHSSMEELPMSLLGAYLELRTKLPPTVEATVYTVEKTDEGFLVNADYSRFFGVWMDGEAVDSENYTVESKDGKTLVTFTEAYLKTLSKGEHTLKIIFTDGYAEIKFSVE